MSLEWYVIVENPFDDDDMLPKKWWFGPFDESDASYEAEKMQEFYNFVKIVPELT